MNYKLTITSPWAGSGAMDDSYRPRFGEDFAYISWMELSVRPSPDYVADPNLGVLECIVEESVLPLIEAHADYMILSCEEVVNALP
jgi:hypothetical protein